MYAIKENMITCSHPKECCQPGTEMFAMPDGTVLEFCEYHSQKLIDWELADWQLRWDNTQREIADAKMQYENLVNEDNQIERTDAHEQLDAILGGDTLVEEEPTISHEDIFKNLDLDDDF